MFLRVSRNLKFLTLGTVNGSMYMLRDGLVKN